tara:strand:+ start:89 stop:478 length:390 start_codon:yes stop_codon:yes gene_type:complete
MLKLSNNKKNILLYSILLFLFLNVFFKYAVPYIVLKTYAEEYFNYSKQCHIVKSENEKIPLDKNNTYLSQNNLRYLEKSYISSLVECYEKEKLHISLLKYGISIHSLNSIDLKASIEAETSLPYLTNEL